jgi:tetratricopeptide (TPR) repeat protein/predicted Ser/Thr protein kinase
MPDPKASTPPPAPPSTTSELELGTSATLPANGSPHDVLAGAAQVGRYLVLSLLGRGGMGEVYSAYDPELDRRVAVKLLHTAQGSMGTRAALLREARALGKLSHPNVVQVHDVGEHDGDVFVAMELIDGEALDIWCAGSPKPTWQEVLAAYVDAARGLAAAHAKGMVHRDVKPSNILRGKDGRVRVADFGLATAHSPGGDASDASSTAIVGTPGYMAPEQFEKAGVGPAADQYCLCTALYQGLYGELPFAVGKGTGLLELVVRKQEGLPPSPPGGSPVPLRVYRALARGLAPRPEDRFPSMEALAAALSPAQASRGARWAVVAVGAAVCLVAALAVALSGAPGDPCAHPERQLAGAWDDGVRGRVRGALAGTGRSYAGATAERVAAILDAYAGSWTAMRHDVCEASRSGRVRKDLAALRDECLDRRLGQLRAVSEVLAEKPDVEVLDRAVQASSALTPIASCADTEALSARVPPPEDPALRARVAAIRPRIDRIEALFHAARYQDGLALAGPVANEAKSLPYPPLEAQTQFWLGELRDATGDYVAARSLFEDCAVAAAEGKDDVLAATAWARILYVVGERQHHLDEAALVRELGRTALARVHDDEAMAEWLNAEGLLLARQMKLDLAIADYERVIAIDEKVYGPDRPELAHAFNNLGSVYADTGALQKAAATLERALAISEKALGPEHPEVASTLNNLGLVHKDLGDYPRALADHERALTIRERALGPDHPLVATSLSNLCRTHLYLAELARARPECARAIAIREKAFGPISSPVAATLDNQCALLSAVGDSAGAIAACERSIAIEEASSGPDDVYVALSVDVLGRALLDAGEPQKAQAAFARALAILEKTLGPDHGDVADPLVGLGRSKVRTGDLDGAGPLLERARALREKELGAAHPFMSEVLLALAELEIARKRPARAIPSLERAATLGDLVLRPEILLTLADALVRTGGDLSRARSLAEEARSLYERAGNLRRQDLAARWLEGHAP